MTEKLIVEKVTKNHDNVIFSFTIYYIDWIMANQKQNRPNIVAFNLSLKPNRKNIVFF